jgi:hypothetical protein
VVKVERRAVIGGGRLKQALRDSEDSLKLNTSFVERLNLPYDRAQRILAVEPHVTSEESNVSTSGSVFAFQSDDVCDFPPGCTQD